MVFVGVQPVLIQVPPASLRSTIAVFFPAPTRTSAKGFPPCPEPMMIASKLSVVLTSALMGDHLQSSKTLGCRGVDTGPQYSQMGDEQETAAHRDQVLDQSQHEIGDGQAEPAAIGKPGERAGDAAKSSQDGAQYGRSGCGEAQGRPAHRTEEDANSQRSGLGSG